MRWTKQEQRDLRKQVKEKVPIRDIKIGDRPLASIKYQIYRLGLLIERWKKHEITCLRKSIKEGKAPNDIDVPGRTRTAIRNKLIRTGLWKTKKRHIQAWKMRGINKLRRLVSDYGYTAKMVFSNEYFPKRSYYSIAHQMRRLGLRKNW